MEKFTRVEDVAVAKALGGTNIYEFTVENGASVCDSADIKKYIEECVKHLKKFPTVGHTYILTGDTKVIVTREKELTENPECEEVFYVTIARGYVEFKLEV